MFCRIWTCPLQNYSLAVYGQLRGINHTLFYGRFMIECRYPKFGSCGLSLASVGYEVTIPTLQFPVALYSQGRYGVHLRLARGVLWEE